MVLGPAALGWSVCCPWWLCRVTSEADLLARMQEFREFPDIAVGIAESHVRMVPLWEVGAYGVHEWLAFNLFQIAGVLMAWAWFIILARDLDARRAALPAEAARGARHRGVNEPGACPPILR